MYGDNQDEVGARSHRKSLKLVSLKYFCDIVPLYTRRFHLSLLADPLHNAVAGDSLYSPVVIALFCSSLSHSRQCQVLLSQWHRRQQTLVPGLLSALRCWRHRQYVLYEWRFLS